MHRCYPGKCKDGFHYSSTCGETYETQVDKYYGRMKEAVDQHYAKDLPRPDNFQILDFEEFAPYVVVKLNYPNCTNFGGDKILVVKATIKELATAQHIDPHFAATKASRAKALPSPEARFPPTKEGWANACMFAGVLARTAGK